MGGSTGGFALSTSMVSILSSTAMSSSASYSVAYEPACSCVDLSTADGAKCQCGKFEMAADALTIKTLTLGEIRQVVASGYKLTHGAPLDSIRWK